MAVMSLPTCAGCGTGGEMFYERWGATGRVTLCLDCFGSMVARQIGSWRPEAPHGRTSVAEPPLVPRAGGGATGGLEPLAE